ncbi:MAG: uroporphyrinogen decarboxylase family protein [Euryarchaeota archaeon]|nr:uroporphyrinogen decarboxylase family protein [Euryarchaeota archaeon]
MTPRERFLAALEMEPVDRPPIFYQHLGAAKWILQHTGLTMREGFHDPEVYAKLALASYELYGFDNVMAGWGDILTEAQAHGMTWKFPERDFYPRPDVHLALSDVDKIVPADPLKDRFWSVPVKAAGIMIEKIGRDVPVVGGLDTPYMIAGNIIGYENLLMGSISDPGHVEKLVETVLESSFMWGEAMSRIGVEIAFLEDGTAGMEQNSLETCMRFDIGYVVREVEHLKKLGMKTFVHNCSAMPFWKEEMGTGADALHVPLRAVDEDELFRVIKGRMCLGAGIDQTELLFKKTPADIEKEVERILGKWGGAPGLIMSPGCELAYKTPMENIQALKEATIRFGSS